MSDHDPRPDFAAFEAEMLVRGFDSVLVRRMAPGTVLDDHEHCFALELLVVEGEMSVCHHGVTRRLLPGDRLVLPRREPHAETYGEQGAVFWVARRHAA
ncbi:AraC family transcriptional regulator [Rubrivivax gelatinosus]|nr:AraC family transcriptional regulator [Rubrivivax gelatinosus]